MPQSIIYKDLTIKVGKDVGIDPKLLSAILEVESNWDTYAVRYEPEFNHVLKADYYARLNAITETTEIQLQKCSWGLGQIMGATARSLGFVGPIPFLCDPEVGMHWAATYLKKLSEKYVSEDDQIAAYNAGSPKSNMGVYANQAYVNKVLKMLA